MKTLSVFQVWALLSEQWCRTGQITALVGGWHLWDHIWGVPTHSPGENCWVWPLSHLISPSLHQFLSAWRDKLDLLLQGPMRFLVCVCPFSLCLGCGLSERANVQHCLGPKRPHRLMWSQPLRLSAGWTPGTSCGTHCTRISIIQSGGGANL